MERSNQQARERTPVLATPAGARLLDYLGVGAVLSIMPGGLAVALQADHVAEVVRLSDLRAPAQWCPAAA
jgi:hypothetical protein